MIDSGLPIAVVETQQRDFGFLEHGAGLTSVGWIVFSFVAAFEIKAKEEQKVNPRSINRRFDGGITDGVSTANIR